MNEKQLAERGRPVEFKVIQALYIDRHKNGRRDGALVVRFTDGTGLMLIDDGRQCCERRYMTTDDELGAFVGAEFFGFEVRDVARIETNYGEHAIQFLLGKTSYGTFTIETHNEHNGQYGGFDIIVQET